MRLVYLVTKRILLINRMVSIEIPSVGIDVVRH